jgi:hypothetical protein
MHPAEQMSYKFDREEQAFAALHFLHPNNISAGVLSPLLDEGVKECPAFLTPKAVARSVSC